MRKFAPAVALAALLAVPLVTGVVLAVWALSVSPLDSAADTAASIGSVEAAERADSGSTTVEYVSGDSFPVATQSAGVITELDIVPGVPIESGSTVMRVDGLPVTAYVSATPLHRDIEPGMEGEDVAAAQGLLAHLGYLGSGADGTAGPVTEAAIRSFNADRGDGTDNVVLSRGSLLWVPDDAGAPEAVSVRTGVQLEPGAEVYVTTAGEAHVSVSVEASDRHRVLTVGEVNVDLAPGETTIADPDIVAVIAGYLGGEASMPATIALADPRRVGTLPAAALVTDAGGSVCFFSGVQGAGTVVEVSDGSFGMVDVEADLVGTPVLLNPRDVREDLTCG